MNHLLRLLLIASVAACAVVLVSLGFVRHDAALMAPVHLVLFLLGVLLYLLPWELAIYRDSKSTEWIALVNAFLGWTLVGWIAVLIWAAVGKVREAAHPLSVPHAHPAPGH